MACRFYREVDAVTKPLPTRLFFANQGVASWHKWFPLSLVCQFSLHRTSSRPCGAVIVVLEHACGSAPVCGVGCAADLAATIIEPAARRKSYRRGLVAGMSRRSLTLAGAQHEIT